MKRFYGLCAAAVIMLIVIAARPYGLSPQISAQLRQRIADQMHNALGLSLSAQDDIVLRLLPFAQIELRDVSISDAQGLNVHAPLISCTLDVWSLFGGHWRINSINIDHSTIDVNLDQEQQQPIDDVAYTPAASSALGRLVMTDSSLHIHSATQDIDAQLHHLSARIDWPALTSPLALEAQVQWQQKTLALAAWLGTPTALMHHASSPLSFKINADAMQVKSSGIINAGPHIYYEGHSDARYISITDVAKFAGIKLPAALPQDIRGLSALTMITPHTLVLSDMRADYDHHKIEGSLSVQKSFGKRPLFSATLATDELDITDKSQTTPPATADDDASQQQMFGSLYDVIGADLDMRISIGRLHLNTTLMREAGISVLLNNGRLDVALAEARLHRGTVRGHFSLTPLAQGFATTLTSNWSHVEVSTLMNGQLTGTELTGESDGTVELSAEGRTIAQSLGQLQGKINISISNGDINGWDIEQALRRLERRPLAALSDLKSGRTGFDQLNLTLDIHQGQAHLVQSQLSGPAVQFDISGGIDARTMLLDIIIIARQNNSKNDDTPTLPLRIKGPWREPKITIDPKNLQNRS